jgi:hypothetical protein
VRTPAQESRTDTFSLYNDRSQRQGYGVIDRGTNTFSIYNNPSQRQGYGVIDRGTALPPGRTRP